MINLGQEEIVEILEKHGSLPVLDIVKLMDCNQSSVNKALKRMKKGNDIIIKDVPAVKGRPVRMVELNGN